MDTLVNILISLLPILLILSWIGPWLIMLVHAIRNDIPHKITWILVLLIGGLLGGIVYFFVVYLDKKNLQQRKNLLLSFGVTLAVLILIPLVALIANKALDQRLPEASLSSVVNQANNGEIKKIEINGEKLTITKKGEAEPSLESRKEHGTSIYEQGLKTDAPVEVHIKNN